MKGLPNRKGTLLGGAYTKDYCSWGSIQAYPNLGKSPADVIRK